MCSTNVNSNRKMATKRITQEAFDEAVRENIDEFEMEREEAIADAVTQFESQGVDLGTVTRIEATRAWI